MYAKYKYEDKLIQLKVNDDGRQNKSLLFFLVADKTIALWCLKYKNFFL